MTGVEGLHERQHLRPAHLTDDEPIGPQPQRRAHELFEGDRRRAVRCRWARFEPDEVVGGRQQLGGVLDGDDALTGRTAPERGVEERGLARRRRAADHHVAARGDQQLEHGDERVRREGVEPERAVAEAAHRQAGTVGRHRRDHRADPRAVGEAGVDDRVGAIEPASERGQDALGDDGQLGRPEVTAAAHAAVALDPDVAVGVHEHLVDRRVGEQRVERTQPVEPGHGGAHEALAIERAGERRDAPQVGAHDDVGVAALGDCGSAELVDEVLVQRGDAHAAPRSSRASSRGTRARSSPASTARGIDGSWLTRATTGAPIARSTSNGRRLRHGSATSTTPSGLHDERRRRASATGSRPG